MVLQTENMRKKKFTRWNYADEIILSVIVAYEVNFF